MTFVVAIIVAVPVAVAGIRSLNNLVDRSLREDRHRNERDWDWCARCAKCGDGFRWRHGGWAKPGEGEPGVCRKCGAVALTRDVGRRDPTGKWEWQFNGEKVS